MRLFSESCFSIVSIAFFSTHLNSISVNNNGYIYHKQFNFTSLAIDLLFIENLRLNANIRDQRLSHIEQIQQFLLCEKRQISSKCCLDLSFPAGEDLRLQQEQTVPFMWAQNSASYILQIKEEREIFIVDQPLWCELSGEIVHMILLTTINRQGVLTLWPIRMPDSDGNLIKLTPFWVMARNDLE